MPDTVIRTLNDLESTLDTIKSSPKDEGVVELIVRRPKTDRREVLDEAELDPLQGLVGDKWEAPSKSKADGPYLENQLTLMNARVIAAVAGDKERWPLAGDQLYVDLDLSAANLPPGTRLELGTAVIEISELPHGPCRKFADRYGRDSVTFLNSATGKELQLRGVNAKVVQSGSVRVGDVVRKQTIANEKQ